MLLSPAGIHNKEGNAMNQEEISRLLPEYAPVIDRVLQRAGVFYHYPDCEDYRQDLSLVLLQWMKKSDSLLHFLLEYPEGKIYQRLLWFLLDCRRKESKKIQGQVEIEKLAEYFGDSKSIADEALVQEETFLACWESLTPSQQNQFWILWDKPQEKRCSRSLLSYYRCQLKKKFKNFYPNL